MSDSVPGSRPLSTSMKVTAPSMTAHARLKGPTNNSSARQASSQPQRLAARHAARREAAAPTRTASTSDAQQRLCHEQQHRQRYALILSDRQRWEEERRE